MNKITQLILGMVVVLFSISAAHSVSFTVKNTGKSDITVRYTDGSHYPTFTHYASPEGALEYLKKHSSEEVIVSDTTGKPHDWPPAQYVVPLYAAAPKALAEFVACKIEGSKEVEVKVGFSAKGVPVCECVSGAACQAIPGMYPSDGSSPKKLAIASSKAAKKDDKLAAKDEKRASLEIQQSNKGEYQRIKKEASSKEEKKAVKVAWKAGDNMFEFRF